MARQMVATPADEHRLRMSYEEYLNWADEDTRAEWVDGEVIVFMPVTYEHQLLITFLIQLLGLYTRLLAPGDILSQPAQLRIRGGRSAREPDVMFLAAAHRDRRSRLGVEGPADLVIEIVSDDSVRRDQIEKRDEYAAAGMPEYWWFDPRPGHLEARFFWLTDDGRCEEFEPDAAGRYHSNVLPGFWVDPDWLWQDPSLDPMDLMAEIAPQAWRERSRRMAATPDAG